MEDLKNSVVTGETFHITTERRIEKISILQGNRVPELVVLACPKLLTSEVGNC